VFCSILLAFSTPKMQTPMRIRYTRRREAHCYDGHVRFALWPLVLCLAACSASSSSSKQTKSTAPAVPAHFTATNTTDSVAKYIELVGLRINERSPGHLVVQFGVVNHSEGEIGDVKMNVKLTTTAAKPGDPPLITFSAAVAELGPLELKNVTVEVPTKLRVYELPDWQFLKPEFQITQPQ
jgi:hypothetical protein